MTSCEASAVAFDTACPVRESQIGLGETLGTVKPITDVSFLKRAQC